MGGLSGQALGMGVGAAVGSFFGPSGALLGAQAGGGLAGYFGEHEASRIQYQLEQSQIALNQEQARLKAAEQSNLHARNFRKALASQLAVASMRGGAGTLAAQFGQESYANFLDDQRAIKVGLSLAEAQAGISRAESEAGRFTRETAAQARLAKSGLSGVDLNLFKERQR